VRCSRLANNSEVLDMRVIVRAEVAWLRPLEEQDA
jgi:hypothetical protein